LASDRDGNIYVVEYGNHRVQKFTSGGTYVTQWGSYGSGDSQFLNPRGIAVDGGGNVYVADSYNYRIQKFTSDGAFITKWGTYGSGDGQFNYPTAVAVDRDGNVYVVETNGNRIQKFTAEGAFVGKWGSYGSGNGQFNQPYGIAINGSGNVYVTEYGGHRVQKFTSDGTYLSKWGSYGSGNGQFNGPIGITVDSEGNVFIGEHLGSRIQKFTSDGMFLTKWGSSGSGDGQFNQCFGLALDGKGSIFVADAYNHRIQRFGFLRSKPLIVSIADVPADQGGKVSVAWQASSLDFAELRTISHYSVWRSLKAMPLALSDGKGGSLVQPSDVGKGFKGPAYRVEHTAAGDYYWEWIANQDAYCFAGYSMTCSTLFDSVAANAGTHYFQVLAHSTNSVDFWASAPDSGHSVDNLAPSAVEDFMGLGVIITPPLGLRLLWDPSTAADLSHYTLHKGTTEDFAPGPANLLGTTTENELMDAGWTTKDRHYYKIAAVDVHGNVGPFTLLRPQEIVIGVLLQSYAASLTEIGIRVSWTLVSPVDRSASHILRCSPPNEDYAELPQAEIGQDDLTFTFVDKSVEPGTTYKYRVEVEATGGSRVTLLETEPITTPALPLTLFQNQPNPFNPSTTIRYYLPEAGEVTLGIYDSAGRLVNRLVDRETTPKGMHQIEWKGMDANGHSIASGVYFYRLQMGREAISRKIVLMR